MPRHIPLPDKKDVIRIVLMLEAEANKRGEGVYEWRHDGIRFLYDIVQCRNAINGVCPGKGEDYIDRLENFKKLYINLKTKEVMI